MESVLPICRVCLNATNDSIDFQTPFQSNENAQENNTSTLNYLECLRLCTNLAIDEHDDGPQCLCTLCESELQIVYKFLQKAKSSQSILEENWQKYQNKVSIEHTEISIEKLEENAEASDNDFEHLIKVKDEAFDMNDYNAIAEMEEDTIEEFKPVIFERIQHLQEDSKILQQNANSYISKKLKCHICNRTYRTSHLLKVHLNYHKRRKDQQYTCKVCNESFSLQRYLTQHMIVHEDFQELHKCEYCAKEYISKTALISHKRIHQGQPLNCNECGKEFSGSYELKVHLRFHRREKEQENNQCEICCKEFSSQRYLNQHMVVHLDDRATHKCNYCDKVYFSTTALNNHKRLHEGHTLECVECGKQFTRSYELKIHMRFHKREHPFECTMCDKKFTIKGHLKTHMWQHQGIKLECEECGKLFASTKALNEHSYTHSEMPYPCDFCSKSYPSRQKYKIHLERVHSSERQEIDLSQLQSLTKTKNLKKRKNFTYVQVIQEHEANEHKQINQLNQ